jgi:hypothetical protein
MQEDVERISSDRLARFFSSKKGEMVPGETVGNAILKKCSSITLGDFVFAKSISRRQTFCGRIIKFQYSKEKTKSARKYKYKSIIFNLNQNVKFLLFPCFTLAPFGHLFSEDSPQNWFESNEYRYTINNSCVDENGKKITQEAVNKIQEL